MFFQWKLFGMYLSYIHTVYSINYLDAVSQRPYYNESSLGIVDEISPCFFLLPVSFLFRTVLFIVNLELQVHTYFYTHIYCYLEPK